MVSISRLYASLYYLLLSLGLLINNPEANMSLECLTVYMRLRDRFAARDL